ncbi:hypothetical protein HDU90_001889 [Geranomyces variabilis]|nr:hypothetical protein HDU90_001889 [Geranomyces variabilis]
MDPGKAKYNSLTSPFEIEVVTTCKAIHILAATIVAQLLTNTGGAPGQSTLEFLRDEALLKIRSALSTPGGLADARDKLCRSLNRVYSVGAGDPSFGQRSAALKATGGRRSMLAVGDPFSGERQQMLVGIMVIVNEHAALGATALLPDLLPCLSFGEIGDAAWQTFVLSSAGNKGLLETAKSYGKHVTDGMSAAEKKAYAAKRFVRMPDAAATLAALRTHNDTCVRKIGAPGYTWLKANDRIWTTSTGESAKRPSTKALNSVAAAIANDTPLQKYSCSSCQEEALRPANKKQQHKCAPGRPYMHPVAEKPVILSFSQLPLGYQFGAAGRSSGSRSVGRKHVTSRQP